MSKHATHAARRFALGAIALALSACARHDGAAAAKAAVDGPAAEPKLERVVMLMRHGVRPPTKAKFVPDGVVDGEWPKWSVGFGELTPHGHDAVKLLGAWDRTHWIERGLLPEYRCPGKDDLAVAASAKSRTQATARALVEGMAPGCPVDVSFPKEAKDDVEFHPLDAGAVPIDADEALRAAQALAPAGGMDEEVRRHAELFALLNRAFGCAEAAACDLSRQPAGLVREEGDGPSIGDPLGTASTVAQTFLLEYLEGMPEQDVAWGRLGRDEIGKLLEFHTLKFRYEARPPYIAARAASPLAARMLEAMESGPKLTVLVGHDTNIANLGGFLDLHWTVPGYPQDDPPPGGALGFEVLSDAAGTKYVRAFYRAQTMDQVRELQPLGGDNAPAYVYLDIPGCAKECRLDDFARGVRAKLVAPLATAPKH
ncbi:histidine-type phosphatase [Pseudoxanthomonas sangjuensis]|uniref:histidine-type phosphatase n=1 Tax=Pseudoxanthomonas sangjuensis TaxID=1503750 RepID=UPI001391D78C|nr:histidine-type phosphatase [Pseudoxanthomonas sangjuensis]KAF1715059.1 histidine-type phosphatase [Pseudoxanthomonas sangjuensis]